MIRFLLSLALVLSPVAFATAVNHKITAQATTGATAAFHLGASQANINQVLQCSGSVATSTGTATVKLQGSNDDINWIDLAICNLTLGTSTTSSMATNTANWSWYRVNVTTLTGSTAAVDAWLSF